MTDNDGLITQTTITAEMIYAGYLENIENKFSPQLLMQLLPEKNYRIYEDTRYAKYFFYLNGIVEVKKEGIKFTEYKDAAEQGLYIWRTQRIERNYVPADEQLSYYERFAACLAAVRRDDGTWDDKAGEQRMRSLWSILGYLMHAWFDTRLFAVNFTDSKMDERGEANGRSGKTTLVRGLQYMLNARRNGSVYVEIGGKNFDFKSPFRYQTCNIDTKLVFINDVYKKFAVEHLFNDITDGLEYQKKNKSPVKINAKMVISSNNTLFVNGDSARDRILTYEASDYFSIDHSIQDEFGCWFYGDDWDAAEWARFDAFMHRCVQFYLANGVIAPQSINLERRMAQNHTSAEFVQWMNERLAERDDDGNENEYRIHFCPKGGDPKNYRIDKKELYTNFCESYPDYSAKNFSQRRFTDWMRFYMKNLYHNIKLTEIRSHNVFYYVFIEK